MWRNAAYLKNPKWVRPAEDLLLSVIRDDPDHVEALTRWILSQFRRVAAR